MSPEQQQRRDNLVYLRDLVASLRQDVSKVSPAAAELLKATERVLTEEIEQ